MKLVFTSSIFLTTILLASCNTMPGIEDTSVKERVIACSGGFSDSANLALAETFDRTAYSGQLSSGFKIQARPIIFSEVPPQDRLAAYQDYIKCIEEKWNTSEVRNFHAKIKEKKSLYKK